MLLRAIACLGALATFAACEAVPDVTYAADDAESDGSAGDAASPDADDGSGTGDAAGDALTCTVPTGVDGGCCSLTIAPCVGIACAHCPDCAAAACRPNQFCCAKVTGGGMYRGVACAPDTTMCP